VIYIKFEGKGDGKTILSRFIWKCLREKSVDVRPAKDWELHDTLAVRFVDATEAMVKLEKGKAA